LPYIIQGPALERLRKTRLMTRQDLADKSGVSEKTIRNNENGTEHVPDPRTILGLATALGVPPADFTLWVE